MPILNLDPNTPNIDPGRPMDTGSVPTLPDPNNPTTVETFEATKISQMYSFVPAPKPHHDTHQIGVRPTPIASSSYRFRNNTVSTDLLIDLTLPPFLSVNLPLLPPDFNTPDGLVPILPPPGAPGIPRLYLSSSEERTITFSFNEEGTANEIIQGSHDVVSSLKWNPIPLNVAGPVYVYKNLPTMRDPNEILPPIQIEGPGGPTTEIKPNLPPEPEVPPTHLYLSLSPSNPKVPFNSTLSVELIAWVGDEFVAPNVIHAKKLTFGPGSLIWSPLETNALYINPMDGASSALFRSRSLFRWNYGRKTNFSVIIAKPPINISFELWDQLYRSQIGVLGDSNAIRVPLPDGTLAYKLTGIAIS